MNSAKQRIPSPVTLNQQVSIAGCCQALEQFQLRRTPDMSASRVPHKRGENSHGCVVLLRRSRACVCVTLTTQVRLVLVELSVTVNGDVTALSR